MVDDSPEDTTPPGSGRAKRAPPTIDLEATEVSGETRNAAAGPEAPPKRSLPWPSGAAISAAIIAAVTGAGAAALVIAAAWFAGWPAVGPTAAPQADAAVIDGLAARIAGIESKTNTPLTPASDPAVAAHIEALEKSVASLRSELSAARAQSKNLEAAVNDFKSMPGESAPPPDLSAIEERLSRIEQARAETKPADDAPLRRVVVAALLDSSVRHGEPYAAALAAAKSLSPDADALKPLDGFAGTGVPSAASLSRELLMLVPKLSPPAQQNTTSGSGIVDRLQAGAARLVRIERTDGVGNDRGAVVARITAAALRNDSNEARRELNTLAPADRAAAQSWIDKSDARDAALASSRQFASAAMAALAQVRQ
jgi:hypothetical protein